GGLFAKGLVCRDNATGSHTNDPETGQILDTGNGGCVYSFQCTFECDECTFSGNHATSGGAIGTLGGKIRVTASTCADNEARYDASDNVNQGCGGCLCQDGTETAPGTEETNYVELCGNELSGNVADGSGGAVQLFYRQGTRTRFAFERNFCHDNSGGEAGMLHAGGGCLYVYVDTETKIEWAPDEGPDEFVVSANAFLDNSAEYLGGGAAIYNIWNTATRFDNNLFLRNAVRTNDQQSDGGGALGLVGAFFDLEHNTFVDNRAGNWTGGVHLGAGGVALRNNIFVRSSAPYIPGGTQFEPSEHVNWVLDETDDGSDAGFLVYASGGNLFMPTATLGGEPRPTPGGAVLDEDPLLGELVEGDAFPPYLPLLSGSPAIDAGVATEGVSVDIRGQPREGPRDIGAFELGP
ncbi:MAG TPA: choice-of-anchor Q domain-containing protein, partial [Nannocystaceae bacterium]|nr:choice-of-anchor Q domain-containing protein [Nannocystaceae bacterium]